MNLHSIFFGGHTTFVFHSNVTSQPRTSLKTCGLPISASSSHLKMIADVRWLFAGGAACGKSQTVAWSCIGSSPPPPSAALAGRCPHARGRARPVSFTQILTRNRPRPLKAQGPFLGFVTPRPKLNSSWTDAPHSITRG